MTFTPKVKKVGTNDREQTKLALALAKEKRFDEALAELEAVLQNNPNSKPAHMGAGNMLVRQQRYDEALAHYQAVKKLDPLRTQAPNAAGKVYLRQGELELAKAEFQAALDIDPQFIPAYQGMAKVLIRQKKYDAALEQLRQALRLDPQRLTARLLISQIYQAQDRLDAAVAELQKTQNLAGRPTARVSQRLGRIYLRQQDYQAAQAAFSEAIDLNPNASPRTKMGLVQASIENNELQEAMEILRQVPRGNKQLAPKIHQLWGDIYQRQGLLQEAAEEYQAAALLASESTEVPEDLMDLEEIESEDEERWTEVVASYQAEAQEQLTAAQTRRRESRQARRQERSVSK